MIVPSISLKPAACQPQPSSDTFSPPRAVRRSECLDRYRARQYRIFSDAARTTFRNHALGGGAEKPWKRTFEFARHGFRTGLDYQEPPEFDLLPYGLNQLWKDSFHSMPLSLDDLDNLLNATSFSELHKKTDKIIANLDFGHFLFGMRMEVFGQPKQDFVISGYPTAWWDRYQEKHYDQIDPVVAHCAANHRPIVWNADMYPNAETAALFDEAASFGLNQGISFPVHGHARREFGLLSLVTHEKPDPASYSIAVLGQGQLLATFLYEAVQKIGQKPFNVLFRKLTPRERDCLRWAAAGKSSWEISCILKTSERTVHFHIGNAMVKLDVVNRQQAIAKGMSLGLL